MKQLFFVDSSLDLVCEHERLDISCPLSQEIEIISAKYGRDKGDFRTCKRASLNGFRQRIQSHNCMSGKSTSMAKKLCNGNQKCSIMAKNNIFGDPCKGIFKYLRVKYKCVDGKRHFLFLY